MGIAHLGHELVDKVVDGALPGPGMVLAPAHEVLAHVDLDLGPAQPAVAFRVNGLEGLPCGTSRKGWEGATWHNGK